MNDPRLEEIGAHLRAAAARRRSRRRLTSAAVVLLVSTAGVVGTIHAEETLRRLPSGGHEYRAGIVARESGEAQAARVV